jgi:hypothetical protein
MWPLDGFEFETPVLLLVLRKVFAFLSFHLANGRAIENGKKLVSEEKKEEI